MFRRHRFLLDTLGSDVGPSQNVIRKYRSGRLAAIDDPVTITGFDNVGNLLDPDLNACFVVWGTSSDASFPGREAISLLILVDEAVTELKDLGVLHVTVLGQILIHDQGAELRVCKQQALRQRVSSNYGHD